MYQTYDIVHHGSENVISSLSIRRDTNEHAASDIIEHLEAHVMTDAEQVATISYRAVPITAADAPGWALFLIECIGVDREVRHTYGAKPREGLH